METAPLPKTRIRPTSFQADQRDTEIPEEIRRAEDDKDCKT